MYAIVETGGKQYRVQKGDVFNVEKLPAEVGETIVLDRVMAVKKDGELKVGKPYVEGASVSARVVKHGKDKKIIVFKYKPKKNYRRKQGHRQPFTQLVVEEINA